MLTIKRVATVVSNYQNGSLEDVEPANAERCGRNCLGKCCRLFSKLPLYAFKKEGDEQIKDGVVNVHEELPLKSFLQNLLFGLWEDGMNKGLFRYDVTAQNSSSISFLLANCLAEESADPFFRLAYNSLGAFATINHLHFQSSQTTDMLSEIYDYPVRSLVFEGGNSKRDLSDAVASSCIFLQNKNIPFNILISDCGREIFVFPQCFAEKQARGLVNREILDMQVNPAGWEISGHIVLKRKKDFEEASEDSVWRLLAEVSLSQEKFEEVKGYVVEACGSQNEEEEEEEEDPLVSASQACVCPNRSQDCLVT